MEYLHTSHICCTHTVFLALCPLGPPRPKGAEAPTVRCKDPEKKEAASRRDIRSHPPNIRLVVCNSPDCDLFLYSKTLSVYL